MRQILVTSALPYANGPIHLGHLVEYIQTDIWVRAMKALGHQVTYVCADDAHGTAIMLKAAAAGITPEQQIAEVKASHEADFAKFLINFDNYHSTHSDENQYFSELIYNRLNAAGHISTRDVEQLFDPEKGMFLADRFVKGDCPECGAADQYGDNCEVCGTTYNATELKQPYSTLSGATPVLKQSKHYFFDLPAFTQFLQDWTTSEQRLQPAIANKLQEWFDAGLASWDISRDAPYFGFKIPNTPADEPDKYFYVWLDAPVGYMASFKNLCDRRDDLNFDDYWLPASSTINNTDTSSADTSSADTSSADTSSADTSSADTSSADSSPTNATELYHFIGKDIVYFHALFWPAMLSGSGFRTPNGVYAHGFLMVNGEKMSKSRGTFIKAQTYSEYLHPEYLRYYFASKLSDKVEDINLDLSDFMQKVNADLVGKVVNIASRSAGFIVKKYDGKLSDRCSEPDLLAQIIATGDEIAAAYEQREFSRAMRLIMHCADKANEYIDAHKPWAMAKQADTEQDVQDVCSVAINIFRQLVVYLAPVLPELAENAKAFLNIDSLSFASREQLLLGHQINKFKPLMQRIEAAQIDAMVAASKDSLASSDASSSTSDTSTANANAKTNEASATDKLENEMNHLGIDHIGIDDFAKVEMKVAHVIACDYVEGADKLLQFSLDVGEPQPRNVFSGIRKFYQPEQLLGKKVICVTNLAPRKMKFGISEGMILSAGDPKTSLMVMTLPDDAPIGSRLA